MNEVTTIEQKVKFFESFKIEVDSLASQTLEYMPGNDSFEYHDVDVYGETAVVRIKNQDDEVILELENRHEDEMIDELVTLFVKHNYDEKTFTKSIQAKYNNNNLI